MEQYLVRLWQELIGRVGGHLSFRFILQPLGAAIIAIRAGLKDARAGRPPFGWSVLTDSSGRGHLLRGGRKDLAQLFIIAVIVDLIYEVFRLTPHLPGTVSDCSFIGSGTALPHHPRTGNSDSTTLVQRPSRARSSRPREPGRHQSQY